MALLVSRGLQGIFRAHQHLIIDFTPHREQVRWPRCRKNSAGQRRPPSRWIQSLGPLDQIVEWFRPRQIPPWLSPAAWAALPSTLPIRELRYTVARPGFRVRRVTLVTTLLDPRRYSQEQLAQAYGLRWTVETAFGHLQTTMKMDVLHVQTVPGKPSPAS